MLLNTTLLVLLTLALFAIELFYFRLAERYSIVDKPNTRSSHTGVVVRGGGIIFFIALLLWFLYSNFVWPYLIHHHGLCPHHHGLCLTDHKGLYFMLGATLVAVVSFLDDVRPQRASIRFGAQLIAVLLLFYDTSVLTWPVYMVIIAAIVCIGTINAFNFMDGINGMTGIYALINLSSFLYIQLYVLPFSHANLIIIAGIAVLIFLFFNFRQKAKCFAGDVGSVTISFLQIFLLIQLIQTTGNYYWVIMFLVYGIDSSVTIVHRILKKENIFRAHRTHLYQYLSNELKWDHRVVALMYGGIQLILNISCITFLNESPLIPIVASILFVGTYFAVRKHVTIKIQS